MVVKNKIPALLWWSKLNYTDKSLYYSDFITQNHSKAMNHTLLKGSEINFIYNNLRNEKTT